MMHGAAALGYLTTAALAGVALWRVFGWAPGEAGLVAVIVAGLFAALHFVWAKRVSDARLEAALGDLRKENRRLTERLEVAEGRADALESAIAREISERRKAIQSNARGFEEMIAKLGSNFGAQLSARRAAGEVADVADRALEAVRQAIEANRIDLHVQPIVTLPQRRRRFFEGFTRLRDVDGKLIMPADFLKAARQAGLLGVIDNLLLFRCVQIVRRLSEKDRRIGIFCNVSVSSLGDEAFFPQFLDFMRENRDLNGSLIFEIGLREFEGRTAVAARNMARLADLGFRFSVDRADTLSVDLPALQDAGVRFMKIAGERLLQELREGGGRPTSSISREIAPQDVPAVFARYGVDLIADRIEEERTVVEVLDFDIPYGQGHVFGEPRPIKDDLISDAAPPDFLRQAG